MDNEDLDESQWAAKLAEAHARASVEPVAAEPIAEPTPDGIADETGPHETTTAEVPKVALDSLIAESAPELDVEPDAEPHAVEATSVTQAPVEHAEHVHAEVAHADADHGAKTFDGVHERAVVEVVEPAGPSEEAVDAALAEIAPLVELLRGGRCVLCVGPRLGDVTIAIRDVLARLVATLPSEDVQAVWPLLQSRPLTAAGFVARRLGDRFALSLAAAMGPGSALPDIVTRLGAMPFRGVVTARCDDWFDRALVRDEVQPTLFTARDGAGLRAHGKLPFVLKLLGCPTRPETLLWSNESLQHALADVELRAALAELWRTRTFVFVGFDAADVELQLVTERFLAGVTPGEAEHYALLSNVGAV
ncbi:MAG TPA: SIR2 family protein [Polyangia bacterium]